MASNDSLTLYSNPICPFAHRAWWALKEKQIPFEFAHIPLGAEKPEWYTKEVNPRGTVPALRHGKHTILESVLTQSSPCLFVCLTRLELRSCLLTLAPPPSI